MPEIEEIDTYDYRIIRALVRNAKLSMSALAERVGLSKTPVSQRVKRLEQSGVIRGYSALLNHSKLGLDHIAFVQVHLSDTRSRTLASFNNAVRKIPEVEQCHMTAASFDYLLKVRTTDIVQFRQVLGETLANLPNVSSTSTYVAMETVKDATLL
ncbi:MAG: Lrp/AsnC family transcriptional regulator [Pseudomonadota bacterium]